MEKAFYESKTFWVNVLMFVLGAIAVFTTGEGTALVSQDVVQWLVVVAALVNLVLRIWFTETAISGFKRNG